MLGETALAGWREQIPGERGGWVQTAVSPSLEALCLLPQMRRNSDSGADRIGVWRWGEKGVLCLLPALIFLVKYNARSRVEGHRCMEFEERGSSGKQL